MRSINKLRYPLCAVVALTLVFCESRAHAAVWVPIDSSYKLTFDEEFNGTFVDTSKWQVPADGTADRTYSTYGNAAFYDSTNLTIANGFANFVVSQCPTGFCTSALTSSYLQTYGYWEARVRMPTNAHGIGADFWMDSTGWKFPEIDVSEWLGVTPTSDYATWHYVSPNNGMNGIGISGTITGLDSGWHVIGMLWSPKSISWYYDGVQKFQTGQYVNTSNNAPEWVILDATVGGFNNNVIDSSTVFPTTFQVDYVHIYSNSPTASAVTPEPGYGGPGDTVGSGG